MRWLHHVAACHGARVVISQFLLRLVASFVYTVRHLTLVASPEVANVSQMCDRIVLSQEGLDLIIGRLVNALDGSERLVSGQGAVTLHVRSEDVGALRIHDVRWGGKVLERVHPWRSLLHSYLRIRRRATAQFASESLL